MRQLDFHIYTLRGLLLALLLVFACTNGRLGGDWSVPVNQISEGEGDGDIPAINQPSFTKTAEANFLTDSSIVLGIKIGSVIRAYPLEILDWHEIVNDQIDSLPIAITYSTLSGSSIALDRRLRGRILQFRVSGLLYNSNTILHEFDTFTDWCQMLNVGIRGAFADQELITYSLFEMTWSKWRQLFPESVVLNTDTEYNRPYGTYPYGDYRTDSTKVLFTLPEDIEIINQIYPAKEKMLGVKVNNVVKGYRLQHFSDNSFSLIQDEINGKKVIIIGNAESKTMLAFSSRTESGENLSFTIQEASNGPILLDNNGNSWTIFGESLETPGQYLEKVAFNSAYWFTWRTFYPNIEIYKP